MENQKSRTLFCILKRTLQDSRIVSNLIVRSQLKPLEHKRSILGWHWIQSLIKEGSSNTLTLFSVPRFARHVGNENADVQAREG